MSTRRTRSIWAFLVVFGFTLQAQAQDERGWNFSGRFSGSSNSSGLVLKVDPSLGYKFNEHFQTYAGLPVYFVNESSSITTSTGFMNGIGNAYLGFRLAANNPAVNYASNLVFTAPTDGIYRIIATSFQEAGRGPYTLRIREVKAAK